MRRGKRASGPEPWVDLIKGPPSRIDARRRRDPAEDAKDPSQEWEPCGQQTAKNEQQNCFEALGESA